MKRQKNQNSYFFPTTIEKLNDLSDIVSYEYLIDIEGIFKTVIYTIRDRMKNYQFRTSVIQICYAIRRGCMKYKIGTTSRRTIFRYVYESLIDSIGVSISKFIEYYNQQCLNKFKNRPYVRDDSKLYGRPDVSQDLLDMIDCTPILKFLFSAPLEIDSSVYDLGFLDCKPSQRNLRNEKEKDTQWKIDNFNLNTNVIFEEIKDDWDDLINEMESAYQYDENEKKIIESGDVEENPGPRTGSPFSESQVSVAHYMFGTMLGQPQRIAKNLVSPGLKVFRTNRYLRSIIVGKLNCLSKIYLIWMSKLPINNNIDDFSRVDWEYYVVKKVRVIVRVKELNQHVRIRIRRVRKWDNGTQIFELAQVIACTRSTFEFDVAGGSKYYNDKIKMNLPDSDDQISVGIESCGKIKYDIVYRQYFDVIKHSLTTTDLQEVSSTVLEVSQSAEP